MTFRLMTYRRRDVLLKAVAVGGLGFLPRQAVAAETVRLMCGYGVGNPTDLCAQLIQDGLSAALDEPVEFDYALGDAGRLAARGQRAGATGRRHRRIDLATHGTHGGRPISVII